MKWNDSFDLGIEEIDKQHRHILTAINALEEAVVKNKVGDLLDKVIKALDAYSYKHFDYEEKMLETHGYPNLDTQLKEHAGFILKIRSFKDKLEESQNPRELGMEICNYLREWFIAHILEKDKKYLSFLKSKGVK